MIKQNQSGHNPQISQNILLRCENLFVPSVVLNLGGNIIGINDPACQVYGWTKESVIGKDFLLLCEPCKRTNLVTRSIQEIQSMGWHLDDNKFYYKNNRTSFPFQWLVTPIYSKPDELNGLLLTAQLQKAEKQAATEEGLSWKNLLFDVPSHIYWKDLNGKYLGCNYEHALSVGFQSPEDIIGKTDYDLPWRQYAEVIRDNDLEVIKKDKVLSLEEIAIKSDGSKITMLSKKAPLKDNSGKTVGIIGVSSDITELKSLLFRAQSEKDYLEIEKARTNYELAEMESKLTGTTRNYNRTPLEYAQNIFYYFDNIIAQVPGNIWWKDKHSVFLGCNAEVAEIAGLPSRYEIVGKTDYDLPWKQSASSVMKLDQQIMKDEITHTIEENISTFSGLSKIYLSKKAPLYDAYKKIVGVLGVAIDITERKQMEAELEIAKQRAESANKAKMEFLSSVSHELRTPLNSILGMAIALSSRLQNEEYRHYAKNILDSGKHLLALVQDILDFARLEEGKLHLEPKPFEAQALFAELEASFLVDFQNKGVNLIFDINKDIPQYILGDDIRIRQIISNLLSNACKFTNQGYVKLSSSYKAKDKTSGIFTVSVKDTGIGIPKNKLKKIFERFEQVQTGYHRSYDGIGLGLNISKHLATMMSGDILVKSMPGKGSVFEFSMPTTVISPSVKYLEHDHSTPEEIRKLHLSVLLVEDNKLNQLVAHQLIGVNLNCQLTIVDNGLDAIKKLQLEDFDIVFMDVGLPDMDGFETTRHIRSDMQIRKSLPIIALTAYASEEDANKCIESGMNDVLTKPIIPEQLSTVISKNYKPRN